jgi:hypothetical protein
MVHIKDEGSAFDAPIEIVWKFLQSDTEHGQAHKTSRNSQMKPLTENSFLLSMEQKMGNDWVKVANRITILPPLGMAIEIVEGPMAGSKFVNYYTPKGNKTEVTVVGEFTSKAMPANQVEGAVRGFLQTMYDEDCAAIKALASKK